MNEPSWTHNDSAETILYGLGSWVRAAPARGPAGLPLVVRMDDRNVYAPDVVWYREGRQPARGDPPPYPVPDLVVEVRSPSKSCSCRAARIRGHRASTSAAS